MKIRYDRPQVWWNEKLNRLRVFIPNPNKAGVCRTFSDWSDMKINWHAHEYTSACCYHRTHQDMKELISSMQRYDECQFNGKAIFLGNL